MLSVSSQLLLSFNSKFLFLGAKSFKISNFQPSTKSNDLISKLDSTRQHESKSMLGFQNRALDTKLWKFHTNLKEKAYLKKCDFKQKLVSKFWYRHWIRGVKMSPKVISVPDFESRLALHAKWCKLKLIIYIVYLKICNFLQTAPNISNIYTKSKLMKCWSII